MKKNVLLAFALLVMPFAAQAQNADTLVTKDSQGQFHPSLAASWQQTDAGVLFVLAERADTETVVKVLQERLALAEIAPGTAPKSILIKGIPLAALLNQLSTLSLFGESDPLGDMEGMGHVVSMTKPESGGSIRASKAMALDDGAQKTSWQAPAPPLRIRARVLAVVRGDFPAATLNLQLQVLPKDPELRKTFRRIHRVNVPVVFAGDGRRINFGHPQTQQNVQGYHLAPNDNVMVHLVQVKDGWVADYVERLPIGK